MLYNAKLNISGNFKNLALDRLHIQPSSVLWNEAHVKLNISDQKGLNEELKMKWNDSLLTLSSQDLGGHQSGDGLSALIPTNTDSNNLFQFATQIDINGSEQILFTPVGKTTTVNLSSSWSHPSFTGSTLPQMRTSDSAGFKATWKSFSHKRDFPQQWKDMGYSTNEGDKNSEGHQYNLSKASFGTNLFIPVNGYQKTMRSIKYAILLKGRAGI